MNVRFTLALLIAIFSTHSQAQFKTLEVEKKTEAGELSSPDLFVGKQYWTSPSGNGIISTVTFYEQPFGGNRFAVTQDSMFTVIEVLKKQQGYSVFLKVQFDDANKTIGYVDLSEFRKKIEPPQKPFFHYSLTTFNISSEGPPSKIVKSLIDESKAEEYSKLEANRNLFNRAITARNSNPPKLGMSKSQVKSSSWGEPNDINRTIVPGKIHEQWVYGWGYVYFENGIVTSIQD